MRIKLHLKSLDLITLNLYLHFLKRVVNKANPAQKVVQKMPTFKKRISILKSPHVNKKAIEQFELSTFKSTVFVDNITTSFLKFLFLNKPKHLNIRVIKLK